MIYVPVTRQILNEWTQVKSNTQRIFILFCILVVELISNFNKQLKITVQVTVKQVTNFATTSVSHHTVQCLPVETLLCSLCQYLKQRIKGITQNLQLPVILTTNLCTVLTEEIKYI